LVTSSAAAVGAVAGSLSVARSAYAAGSDEIKIGLIGCGGRGSGAAGDTLSANKSGVKITAVGDAFEDRMRGTLTGLQRRFGDRVDVPKDRQFVGFDAYKKVIDSGIDMVILATPPGFRPLHFEAAVKAGKHVFMEKPVAVDGAGVRQVLEAAKIAKEKNLGVGVGLQRRHENSYLETIKRLQEGAIGDIVCTRVYWNGAGVWVNPKRPGQSEMEHQMRNWYYFNWLCGDHIVEQHIHNLDVGNWLVGDHPERAQGMGGREVRTGKEFGEIFDHHYVEFTYKDGRKMFSCCRHIGNCWDNVSEHAHGTKGSADISGHRIRGGDGEWRYRGQRNRPYEQEHLDLVNSIRAGHPLAEAEYGATSTMTAVLGRLATYSGKVVSWKDALDSPAVLAPGIESYTFDSTPPVLPDEQGSYKIAVPGRTDVFKAIARAK
jgi:predicted dehydrogenase